MNLSYDIAIGLINEYIERFLNVNSLCVGRQRFVEKCYARWAAKEILSRVRNRIFDISIDTIQTDVFDIVDGFIFDFCCLQKVKYSRAFQVAIDTGESIKIYLRETKLL